MQYIICYLSFNFAWCILNPPCMHLYKITLLDLFFFVDFHLQISCLMFRDLALHGDILVKKTKLNCDKLF